MADDDSDSSPNFTPKRVKLSNSSVRSLSLYLFIYAWMYIVCTMRALSSLFFFELGFSRGATEEWLR